MAKGHRIALTYDLIADRRDQSADPDTDCPCHYFTSQHDYTARHVVALATAEKSLLYVFHPTSSVDERPYVPAVRYIKLAAAAACQGAVNQDTSEVDLAQLSNRPSGGL